MTPRTLKALDHRLEDFLQDLTEQMEAQSGAFGRGSTYGLGAMRITKNGTAPLAANDLTAAAVAKGVYDGTEWQLQIPQTATSPGAVSLPTPGTAITLSSPSGFAICTAACTVTRSHRRSNLPRRPRLNALPDLPLHGNVDHELGAI